jgi:hypothetical protein
VGEATAQRIARQKAAALRQLRYRELCKFEGGSSPEQVHEGGVTYFVEIEAAFEGETDNLRVVVTVDDFSTDGFRPAWEDFVASREGVVRTAD